MSWFSSWDDFTKKASEVAKSATEKATEAAKVAADKSKVIAAQVNEKVNQFVEEQKKEYNAVEQETDLSRRKKLKHEQIMSSGRPPWYIDENTHPQQTQFMDELRLNILKLCEDENNFLIKAPTSTSVFDFNLEYALPYAQCALREDPVLPTIRFKMVPRKLTEDQFWKNYFYRVNVIRESLNIYKIDFSKPPIANQPRSRSPSGSRTEKTNANETQSNNNDKEESTDSKTQESVKDNKDTTNEQDAASKNESNEAEKTENQAQIEHASDTETKSEKQSKSKTTTPRESASATESMPHLEDNGIKMDLSNNPNDMPSSDHITEMPSDTGNDMDLNADDDNDEFLSDELHIDSLTNEERAKKMKELGIDGSNDVENVDDLLAGVNMDNVDELSDGELEKELKNIQ